MSGAKVERRLRCDRHGRFRVRLRPGSTRSWHRSFRRIRRSLEVGRCSREPELTQPLLYLTRGELEFQLLVLLPIAFALKYFYNKRRDGR